MAWVSWIGAISCVAALAALIWRTAADNPAGLWMLGGMLGLAFAVEAGYRGVRKREINVVQQSIT